MDALLGAAGLGDIGEHFPDTDRRFEGADSIALLREVVARLAARGLRIVHVDATVCCERPKLGAAPRRDPRLARRRARRSGRAVNVKATTGEGMGFVGREEGVAALAVATASV